MKKNINIIAWIAAIALSLTLAVQTQAHERTHRYAGERNSHVVVTHPGKIIYTGGRHSVPVIVIPNNHRHFAKVTHRGKVKKIRRIRRAYAPQRIDRPVVIITREIYR
ncbi:MAG: hypothetical protein KDF58_01440 [Alphaproteobacteria bacterium]|nr:hypothetical protein [Alphaproteobacteria bacterium]HPF46177.1 hypothetical protein [Emcibacteraceae bacterium]HRW30718.1 hypothetical protein [Emcibacteraceae bacterium]